MVKIWGGGEIKLRKEYNFSESREKVTDFAETWAIYKLYGNWRT